MRHFFASLRGHSIRRTWNLAGVGLVASMTLLAGCGQPPVVEPDALKPFLAAAHREDALPLTVSSVEITASEATEKPGQVRVRFTGQDKISEDLCQPWTLEQAFAHYKFDVEQAVEGQKRWSDLRFPERDAAAKSRPEPRRFSRIHRQTRNRGDVVEISGTAVLERENETWRLIDLTTEIPDGLHDKSLIPRSKLPKDVIVIDDAQPKNSVSEHIDQQRAFLLVVEQAERSVKERLEREHQQLLAASEVGKSWAVSLPSESGLAKKLRMTIVQRTDEGASLAVLMVNVDNPAERSIWIGALELAPIPSDSTATVTAVRRLHDGWNLTLKAVAKTTPFPVANSGNGLVVAPAADGLITWFNAASPVVLKLDPNAPPLPSPATLAKNLKEWTAAGQVWEGLFQQPEKKSEKMRLTFTEVRDNGQYVRAVLESLDEPWQTVVFEGSIDTNLEALYCQPIRLKRELANGCEGGHPLFTLYPGTRHITSLALMAPLSDDAPMLRDGGLELKRAAPLEDFESNKTQWKKALTPGTQWSGAVSFGDKPPQDVLVTIAEVRDELGYVRLLVEDKKVRTRLRILEGTLNRTDARVDGYALNVVGLQRATQPLARTSAWGGDLFGVQVDDKSAFRLSPDGKSLLGRTAVGEWLTLTREKQPAALPMEKGAAAAHWRKKLVKGARWRGTLYNNEVEKKIEVELEITSEVDGEGNLTATIRIPQMPKARIDFVGLVRLEKPGFSNAFALDLTKKTRGVDSNSPVFGRWVDNHVHFRFATDGDSLLGYSDAKDGVLNAYLETLELAPVGSP